MNAYKNGIQRVIKENERLFRNSFGEKLLSELKKAVPEMELDKRREARIRRIAVDMIYPIMYFMDNDFDPIVGIRESELEELRGIYGVAVDGIEKGFEEAFARLEDELKE